MNSKPRSQCELAPFEARVSHEAEHGHVVEDVFPRPKEDGPVVSAEERQGDQSIWPPMDERRRWSQETLLSVCEMELEKGEWS